jgi:hypothetical protein
MMRLILILSFLTLAACSTGSGTAIATCNSASDARCVGEHVGSTCTTNLSHTCIKTGGGALRPVCDCLDSQGGPVAEGWGETVIEDIF